MKHPMFTIILFLSGLVTSEIYSQSIWQELPTDNSIFSTHFYAIGEAPAWLPTKTRHLSFNGDTLINGILYSRLIANMDTVPGPGGNNVLEIDKYIGAVHQENNVVSIIRVDESELDTLYNYNVDIGDIVATVEDYPINNCQGANCPYIQLTSKDTVTLGDGILRQRLNFDIFIEGQNSGPSHSVIEGIGSTLGLLNDPTDVLSLILAVQSNHPWRQLLCYETDGDLIYAGDEYAGDCNKYKGVGTMSSVKELIKGVTVFPNPVNGLLTVDIKSQSTERFNYRLFDSKGIITQKGYIDGQNHTIDMENLSNGLYILKLENATSIAFKKLLKID